MLKFENSKLNDLSSLSWCNLYLNVIIRWIETQTKSFKWFRSQNINKVFLFSRELQQLAIDWKKNRYINVYRSNVKITTSYNSHRYQITRQISVLELFCRARLSFLFKYFVKKVLFCSLSSGLRSLQSPVLIICAMGSLKVASTNLSTTIKRLTPLTVTWSPN